METKWTENASKCEKYYLPGIWTCFFSKPLVAFRTSRCHSTFPVFSIQLLTARMKSASSTSSKKNVPVSIFSKRKNNPQGTNAIRWWSLFTFPDLSTVSQTCYGVVFHILSALSWLCCTQIAASDRSHFLKKKLYHIAIFLSQKTGFFQYISKIYDQLVSLFRELLVFVPNCNSWSLFQFFKRIRKLFARVLGFDVPNKSHSFHKTFLKLKTPVYKL